MWYSPWKRRPSRRIADSRRVRPCLECLEDRTLLSGLTTFVYTESNDSNGNVVFAFQQNANGTLTETGAFGTGGYGFRNISPLLGPNDSSFEVITTPDNRFLFAVNQGSSSVSAFSINSDGGLTLVGTFNSGGVQPDSLAVSGNHLYVTNRGDSAFNPGNGTAFPSDDVPNITVFNIGGNGALTPIPGSTVTFNEQSSPSHSLITPDGKLLFVDNFATPAGATQAQGGNTMIPFQIQANGTLVPVASGPVGAPVATPLLLGAVLNPNARIIYAGLALDNEIAVFSYDASGNITFVGNTGVITGTTPCWAAVSADGKFLYTGDSNSDSVGVFSLANPMSPVEIQEFTLNGPYNPGGTAAPQKVRAFQVALSPDGQTLYAISAANTAGTSTDPLFPGGNQVHALTVNTTTGMLSEPTGPVLLDTFGVPGDAAPQGAAVITINVPAAPPPPPAPSVGIEAVAAGGSSSRVNVYNTSGALTASFLAFDPSFTGGATVAVGNLNGSTVIVVGAGPGGGPEVKVIDASKLNQVNAAGEIMNTALLADFFAFDPTFTGGVNVAVGAAEVVAGAGAGGGPEVKVIDGSKLKQVVASGPQMNEIMNSALLGDFFAYDPSFHGGVNVAVGDVNGDGVQDVITGAGAGGGPEVKVIDGTKLGQKVASGPQMNEIMNAALLADFFAYDPTFMGGVTVAFGAGEVVTGAGPGGGPEVKVIAASKLKQTNAAGEIVNTALLGDFFAYDPTFTGGVNVAAQDVNGDGVPDVLTGPGAGSPAQQFQVINGTKLGQRLANGQIDPADFLFSVFPFGSGFTGGVAV